MKFKYVQSDEHAVMVQSQAEFKDNANAEMNLIKIYPEETRQTILGFGGAFTEAAAATAAEMSDKVRAQALAAYFGEEGNRYNFCRTHIQSCDFALGNYAYIEDANDTELKAFNLERDQQYLIPMLKEALVLQPDLQLLASPWSPPAFMKSNGEMNHGGVLKKEYYQMWSDMIVRYVEEYQKLGIGIHRISVQNEPKARQTWDSCLYTAAEEGIFAAEFLRKGLDSHGFSHIKIAVWDHNKDCILERVNESFAVAGAKDSIGAIAFHWYTGDHFEALGAVREKYPDKELIMSEGCVEYSRFAADNQVRHAEMYLHDIIGNLNQGMNAYIDWNLILNEQGGPNHVGNFCDAPVMYNRETDTLDFKLSYYYIGHISRFVRPGAKRILVSRYTEQLDAVGFINPDQETVVVLMNKADHEIKTQICTGNMLGDITLPGHSATTVCW